MNRRLGREPRHDRGAELGSLSSSCIGRGLVRGVGWACEESCRDPGQAVAAWSAQGLCHPIQFARFFRRETALPLQPAPLCGVRGAPSQDVAFL